MGSGEITVQPGVAEVRQPVPPGELTIGCEIAGEIQRRRVDLVDLGGYYRTPSSTASRPTSSPCATCPWVPGATNIIVAARSALDPHLTGGTEGDGIGPIRGYQSQRLGDATDDPVVQVTRDGTVVAFAHVRGAEGAVAAPWTAVSMAEVCGSAAGHPAADRDVHDAATPVSLITPAPRACGPGPAISGRWPRCGRRTWPGCCAA